MAEPKSPDVKPPVALDETLTATPEHAGLAGTAASPAPGGAGSSPSSPSSPGGARGAPTGLPTVRPEVYEVGAEVARGGMGRIVAARDRRLDRTVAIKEVHRGTQGLAVRFEREALITARLQHPAIVPVYEAGRWPDGEPFYAMRLVHGRSLRDELAERPTLDDRLALLPNILTVVEAIAYAHGERVIHRDLKPANILVGRFAETVVIDWGLAKDLAAQHPGDDATDGAHSPSSPDSTVAGAVLGTPAFMSPEQAAGKPVDERTDVYALGAIIYQVVAGDAPYADYKAVDLVIAAAAHGPPASLAELAPDAPADLVAIVERAMARDPAQRYRTAGELADELRRFLTGKLVAAHRYTRWQLTRRWLRRYRAPLAVAAPLVVLLVAGSIMSFQRIVRERDAAAAATRAEKARAEELTLGQARAELARDPHRALRLLSELSPGSPHWPAARVLTADALAHGVPRVLRGHASDVYALAVSPRGDMVASGDAGGAVRLWHTPGGAQTLRGAGNQAIVRLAFSSDGRWLAAGDLRGVVWRWDLLVGGDAKRLGSHGTLAMALAFSPDGDQLASAGGDGKVRIWSDGGQLLHELPGQPDNITFALSFAPAGHTLAAGSATGVTLFDTETGKPLGELAAGVPIVSTAFSPDGLRVAAGSRDDKLRVWPVAGGAPYELVHGGFPLSYEFSPSGRYLLSVDVTGVARLWDLQTRTARELAGRGKARANDVTFTRDGRGAVVGFSDGLVARFDTTSGERRDFTGHGAAVLDVAVSVDDALIISAGEDETVRLWPVESGEGRPLAHPLGKVLALSASADLELVAAVGTADGVWLWEPRGERGRLLPLADGWQQDVAVSADGAFLATVSMDRRVRVFDVAGGRVTTLACAGRRGASWQPAAGGGHVLAVPASEAEGVCLYDADAGRERLARGLAFAGGIRWAAGGDVFVAGGADGSLSVWRQDGELVRRLPAEKTPLVARTLTPDGARLITADRDGRLVAWPLSTGDPVVLERSLPTVQDLAVSPDGRTLAAVTSDGALARLPLAEGGGGGDLVLPGTASLVRWSGDGSTLVVPLETGAIAWVHHATGEQRRLEGHDHAVNDLAVSRDGRKLITTAGDGSLRFWLDDVPDDPAALRSFLRGTLLAPVVLTGHGRFKARVVP